MPRRPNPYNLRVVAGVAARRLQPLTQEQQRALSQAARLLHSRLVREAANEGRLSDPATRAMLRRLALLAAGVNPDAPLPGALASEIANRRQQSQQPTP